MSADMVSLLLERAAQLVEVAQEDAAETTFRIWRQRVGNARSDGATSIIEAALDAALAVTSADCANIQLVQHDNGLIMKGHRGFSHAFVNYFQIVNDGKTACRAAWEQRRLIYVPDITASAYFSRPVLETLLGDGIRAVGSIPLFAASGQMVGVLSVHYRQPYSPKDAVFSRFERLARSIATILPLTSNNHKQALSLHPTSLNRESGRNRPSPTSGKAR
jgi:GAF domain-containing protein